MISKDSVTRFVCLGAVISDFYKIWGSKVDNNFIRLCESRSDSRMNEGYDTDLGLVLEALTHH